MIKYDEIMYNKVREEGVQMKKLAQILFIVGLLLMFSGVSFLVSLFFIPDELELHAFTLALILILLFFIDVPIYNHINNKIEKNDGTNNEP